MTNPKIFWHVTFKFICCLCHSFIQVFDSPQWLSFKHYLRNPTFFHLCVTIILNKWLINLLRIGKREQTLLTEEFCEQAWKYCTLVLTLSYQPDIKLCPNHITKTMGKKSVWILANYILFLFWTKQYLKPFDIFGKPLTK